MRDILNITITAVIAPIVVSVSVHALNEAYGDWLESHRCKKRKSISAIKESSTGTDS